MTLYVGDNVEHSVHTSMTRILLPSNHKTFTYFTKPALLQKDGTKKCV